MDNLCVHDVYMTSGQVQNNERTLCYDNNMASKSIGKKISDTKVNIYEKKQCERSWQCNVTEAGSSKTLKAQ